MAKVKVVVKKVGGDKTWEEEYDIPRDGESAQAIIDRFNATLKPGETARELVSEAPVSEDHNRYLSTDEVGFEAFVDDSDGSVMVELLTLTDDETVARGHGDDLAAALRSLAEICERDQIVLTDGEGATDIDEH